MPRPAPHPGNLGGTVRYSSPRAEKWAKDLRELNKSKQELATFVGSASTAKEEVDEISSELKDLDQDVTMHLEDLEDLAEDVLEVATDVLGLTAGNQTLRRSNLGLETQKARDRLEKVLEQRALEAPKEFSKAIQLVRSGLGDDIEKANRELADCSKKMTRLREKISKRVDCAAALSKEIARIDAEQQERRAAAEQEHAQKQKESKAAPRPIAVTQEKSMADEVEAHRELYEAYASKRRKLERELTRLMSRYGPDERQKRQQEHRRIEKELKDVEAQFKEDEKELAASFRSQRNRNVQQQVAVHRDIKDTLLELDEHALELKKQAEADFDACQAYRAKLLDVDSPL